MGNECWEQFRDRAVAAPLKLGAAQQGGLVRLQFRDRAVAAPLKRSFERYRRKCCGEFRDRAVAAPLKLDNRKEGMTRLGLNSATARSRPH